jgi:ArsR family transcriptional regulator
MDKQGVIQSLAALAQPTRLDAFRLLVRAEPAGLPAGDLARALAVPQNTLSAHLAILSRAGLAHGARKSRSIIYRADLARLRDVAAFLVEDCCAGAADCAPALPDMISCTSKEVGADD